MTKPKILIVYDVPNWAVYKNLKYFKYYFSDSFDVDSIDEVTLNKEYEKKYTGYDIYYLTAHTMLCRGDFPFRLPKGKIVTKITGRHVIKNIFKTHYLVIKSGNNNINPVKLWVKLANRCAAVFVNNKLALNDVMKKHKINVPVFYSPYGVDTEVFKSLNDIPVGKDFTIIFVGKPVPEKGIDLIKEVAKRSGVKLIMHTNNWTNSISRSELTKKIYNKGSTLLVASSIDGGPNTSIEMMACGRPIIGNEIGNIPELVRDGINGFIVKHNDVENYLEKLAILINRPAILKRMGKEARETILNNGWTIQDYMNREKKYFKKILG